MSYPRLDEAVTLRNEGRHPPSTPFMYTAVTGLTSMAHVKVCDGNVQTTCVSVPPGSTWKIVTISLS